MQQASQSLEALAVANQVRLAGSLLKKEIAAGATSAASALTDPRARGLTVSALLISQHGWGRTKTLRLLRKHHISESRYVVELTDRQIGLLRVELEASTSALAA